MDFINGLQSNNFSLQLNHRKKPHLLDGKCYKDWKVAIGEDIKKCVRFVSDSASVSSFWNEIIAWSTTDVQETAD